MKKRENRILSYDIIRIVAILMVVMIHVSGVYTYQYLPKNEDFIWGTIFSIISRAAVPLLFMLSGALLLNENKKICDKTILKHAANLGILLFIWSLFYTVVHEIIKPIYYHAPISIHGFIYGLIRGHYHLWFLFTIIGLYLITPILRLFVKNDNKKYILYFIALSVLFQFCTPVLNFFVNELIGYNDYFQMIINRFHMEMLSPYLSYFFVGWYLSNNRLSKQKKKIIYILGIVSLLISVGVMTISAATAKDIYKYNFIWDDKNILMFFYSVSIFEYLFSSIDEKKIKNRKINELLINLSIMSFGVYVIHVAVIDILNQCVFKNQPAYLLPLMCLLTVIISYLITFIASKIPLLKKAFRC